MGGIGGMAAAERRDRCCTVTAGDLEGGGESSLLEGGLYEHWIFHPERSEGVGLFGSVQFNYTRVATVGVSGQEKSLSSEGKSWRSGVPDMILYDTTGRCWNS